MERPIQDPNLAMEMAYAEKPYRDMAKIAFSHEDPAIQDEGLRLARLGVTASTQVYYEVTERRRVETRYAEAQQKNINIAAYLEVATPRKYITDLRAFSKANATTLGGLSKSNLEEPMKSVTELVRRHEDVFNLIEQRAGVGRRNDHYIGTLGLEQRMRWLSDKNNWKHAQDYDAALLLSYTRHILGFHKAADSASAQEGGVIPSFNEIPDELRIGVYEAVTDEWFTYIDLVTRFGAVDRITGKNRPLLYNSVDVLSRALNQERSLYVSMKDKEIVQAFEKSSNFEYECEWIMKEKQQKNLRALEESAKRNPINRLTSTPVKTNSYLEITLNNADQQRFATMVDYETVLPIDNNQDIAQVLKAIARSYALQAESIHGNYAGTSLFAGFNQDMFSEVRPKGFNGRIENTRMRYLPMSEEFIESYLKKRKLDYVEDIALVSRIGVFSDMYSTGRGKVGEAMQEYVIYGRNVQNIHSRTIRVTKIANMNGDKLVEYLKKESDKIDYVVTHNNMSTPLSGGAPSLGKRR